MHARTRGFLPVSVTLCGVVAALSALIGPMPASAAPGGPAPAGGWVAGRVRFEPLDPATTGLSADGGPGHRGALELAPGGSALVDLPVDDYVRGIQEVPLSWPAAALQAQAVAARTFALYTARQARARPGRSALDADICATESCQVYTGLAAEQRPGGPAWATATAATAGKVLLHKGAPLLAKYSSSNGGASVAGGQPYLRAVADPDDAASPLHRWASPLDLGALTSALGLPGRAAGATRSGGTVAVAWERPASAPPPAPPTTPSPPAPPVLEAAASTTTTAAPGPERGERRFPVADFRARVNAGVPQGALPRTLPSDQFTLVAREGAVVAEGRGFGHFIGMSQWGAFGKAQRGLSADAILAAYYNGARPQPTPAGSPGTLRVTVAGVTSPVVRAVPTGAGAGPGAFRVVADGAPLATVATGSWKVAPGPRAGTLRIVPPPEQAGAVALDQVGAGRTAPDPAAPVAVAFRLSQPALVTVTGGSAQPLAAGKHRVEAPGGPEARTVAVSADAGGGRTALASVEVAAVAPAPSGEAPSLVQSPPGLVPAAVEDATAFGPLSPAPVRAASSGPSDRWVAALALVPLVAVGWAARRGRRLHSLRRQRVATRP